MIMGTKPLVAAGLILATAWLGTTWTGPANGRDDAMPAIEARFRSDVAPFLKTYCLGCHSGEKPKGDLDLGAFTSAKSVASDLPRWELVLEQLDAGSMPPAKAKRHPSAEEGREIIAWIKSVRGFEAARTAGDPGPVPARRLSNYEYDYTIRDLTGVDLRPTREFPVDPANGAGFDNSAESLSMSPALVKKYLDAARSVADHVVLTPTGLAFASHPMLADTDRDKYCVNRVIDFYKRQKTDYADYFFAAWRFRHREALKLRRGSLDEIASESGLSAKYLRTISGLLDGPAEEFGPIAAMQAMWKDLPAPEGGNTDAARAGCERMRDVFVNVRKQLTRAVQNLPERGFSNGSQPLVLWKNRQFVANRMRYTGGARTLKTESLPVKGDAGPGALAAVPRDPKAAGPVRRRHSPASARPSPTPSSSRRGRGSTSTPRRTRTTPGVSSAPASTA